MSVKAAGIPTEIKSTEPELCNGTRRVKPDRYNTRHFTLRSFLTENEIQPESFDNSIVLKKVTQLQLK
jgi:hypothetical protein